MTALPLHVNTRVSHLGAADSLVLIEPAVSTGDVIVCYLHGGLFVIGTAQSRTAISSHLASTLCCAVISINFRLAPEHPYPAALGDADEALRLCAYTYPGVPIVIAGDSSGAGLALSLMLRLRDRGDPMPAAAVLFSPWADLSMSGSSYGANGERDVMLTIERLNEAASAYLGDASPTDPYVSPRFGDFTGLPPILIFVSSDELLRDDSVAIARSALEAGVIAKLHEEDNLFHGWPVAAGMVPEADEAIQLVSAFVNEVLCRA